MQMHFQFRGFWIGNIYKRSPVNFSPPLVFNIVFSNTPLELLLIVTNMGSTGKETRKLLSLGEIENPVCFARARS
jgi:hypothetical protein